MEVKLLCLFVRIKTDVGQKNVEMEKSKLSEQLFVI